MTIKERILTYLKSEGISREDFYKTTGLSASNFKGAALNSELGGDKIVKILSIYRDISPDWLLMGEGLMLRNSKTSEEKQITSDPNVKDTSLTEESLIYKMYKEEKAGKEAKIEEIGVLKEKIRQLEAGNLGGKTSAKPVSSKKHSSQNADDVTSVTVP